MRRKFECQITFAVEKSKYSAFDKGSLFANRLLVWNYWYEPVIGVNECIVAANLMYYRETLSDWGLMMVMVRYT